MPRNHDQCRVRRRARSSRSPKWAACTIATNAWRPEVAILRTRGSSIAGPTGGAERVESRRLGKIRSAPSPEGPPLLDRTTPARKTRLPGPASSDNVFANDSHLQTAAATVARQGDLERAGGGGAGGGPRRSEERRVGKECR